MSKKPHLYCHHVKAKGLVAAVEKFKPKLNYLYFESEATIELVAYCSPDPAWKHGRAFGRELEIRWQRNGDGFDLLLITEMALQLPAGWRPMSEDRRNSGSPLPDSVDPLGQVLLWGTHFSHLERPHRLAGEEGEAWIETRIPRPLAYPVAGSPRWVKAKIIVYRCQDKPVLTRLVDLEGESNEPQTLW